MLRMLAFAYRCAGRMGEMPFMQVASVCLAKRELVRPLEYCVLLSCAVSLCCCNLETSVEKGPRSRFVGMLFLFCLESR